MNDMFACEKQGSFQGNTATVKTTRKQTENPKEILKITKTLT